LYKIIYSPKNYDISFYIYCLLIASVLIVFFLFCLIKLKIDLKLNLSIFLITIFLSIYFSEIYLEFRGKNKDIIGSPKVLDPNYDTRTKEEVIDSFKINNIETYPSIPIAQFISSNGIQTNSGMIFPLGGISNTKTVHCNESGIWSIYESDEHGFNNTKGLYNNNIDIILLGDSFAQGSCVNPDETIAAGLRKSDLNAISLGMSGNGPLIELAGLKEYGIPLKPKVVLWLYYTNDMTNLYAEIKSDLLKKYLYEKNFTQNLFKQQKIIRPNLINYINNHSKNLEKNKVEKNKNILSKKTKKFFIKFIKISKLSNLRKILNFKSKSKIPSEFVSIIEESKRTISLWDGKLYFIYLPDYYTYSINKKYEYLEELLKIMNELQIPIINIHSEAFIKQEDPMSLFPSRKFAHYNKKGYHLIKETIINRLKKDGLM